METSAFLHSNRRCERALDAQRQPRRLLLARYAARSKVDQGDDESPGGVRHWARHMASVLVSPPARFTEQEGRTRARYRRRHLHELPYILYE